MDLKKKLFTIIIFVLAVTLVISSVFTAVAVTTFTVGDYVYAAGDDNTCYLYAYNGNETDLELPDRVSGRTVIGIYNDCFKNSNLVSVEIPESCKTIGDNAFYGCNSLKKIILPSDLTSVGRLAFSKCGALEYINMKNCASLATLSYGLFLGDESLTEISLPKNLTVINDYAFSGTALSYLNMPSSVTKIGAYAFYGCDFKLIVFPPNLETLGSHAYAENHELFYVDFPFTVTSIGDRCFENDEAFESLFVPDSVDSIGEDAFSPVLNNADVQITCHSSSYAAEYFEANGAKNLKIVDRKRGDSDLNGKVNIRDATRIQYYRIGKVNLSTYREKLLADYDGNGEVTIRDATYIQMFIAKMIDQ